MVDKQLVFAFLVRVAKDSGKEALNKSLKKPAKRRWRFTKQDKILLLLNLTLMIIRLSEQFFS